MINMLTMTGKIANVYVSPTGKKKDTGEVYGGDSRLQLICEVVLRNGEVKVELQDLLCNNPEKFQKEKGKQITVPVGFYIGNGAVRFYLIEEGTTTQ